MSQVRANESGPSGTLPLVVDLDGTLIKTDLLLETALALLRASPVRALLLAPFWLLKGRAVLKREIARRVELRADLLPYRAGLIDFLRAEHSLGRRIVLVSASDDLLVKRVADHLGMFDECRGSDGQVNLKGWRKRDWLVERFGQGAFDYVGDSRADLCVWETARRGIVVSGSRRLRKLAGRCTQLVDPVVLARRPRLAHLKALRPHHWVKNVLVFVPALAAHRVNELDLLAELSLGFAAFSLLASGLYVFNDLLDLNADRRHPRKRLRPLASGDVPLAHGVAIVPVLLGGALVLGLRTSPDFLLVLCGYGVLTLAYSLRLKQIVLLDVIVLASLFMLRIIAGAEVGIDGISLSRWLLGFSMFFFVSLAFLKRYTEIITMRAVAGRPTNVRGYQTRDSGLILSVGSASGTMSVIVLALYVETATAERLYTHNELIWLVCPLLLYWISYLWLMAHRNRMPHDPLVFALRNRTSRRIALLMAALVVLAV